MRGRASEQAHELWQARLDELKTATEKGFAFSADEMQSIKNHEIADQEPADDALLYDGSHSSPMADDDLASNFGAGIGASDGEEAFDYNDYVTLPLDQMYDPGAFPRALQDDYTLPAKRKGKCIFCLPDPSNNGVKQITYTNVQLLHKFINDRGMITSRRWNYNCAKHQRKLARAIKNARYIGLLSYIDNFYAPRSFSHLDMGTVVPATKLEHCFHVQVSSVPPACFSYCLSRNFRIIHTFTQNQKI